MCTSQTAGAKPIRGVRVPGRKSVTVAARRGSRMWYQGELWASSERGVWCLKETGFETPDLPDFVLSSTGAMSAAHGMLLLAGWYQASLFDGQVWTSLVDLGDLYCRYGGHP